MHLLILVGLPAHPGRPG